ncbi:MAG: glycosyltransferase, partial [Deltaproteobacteria bacterium]|nr:glycosyltransferase [Deltaproteobacteria bacterium]
TWFGYIGSLHSWQGLETALQAFAMTAADIPETRMLIVTGERRAALKALRKTIRRLGLSDRVLIRLPLAPEGLAAVIAALRFTVAPLAETTRNVSQGCCPVKIVESMAAGTAVIASDLGPCRELISQGRDGLLVPAGEPRRWAVALRRLCLDDTFARALSENARKRAERSFHYRRIRSKLNAWLTTLDSVVAESESKRFEDKALRL